jgi:hypothetical protein
MDQERMFVMVVTHQFLSNLVFARDPFHPICQFMSIWKNIIIVALFLGALEFGHCHFNTTTHLESTVSYVLIRVKVDGTGALIAIFFLSSMYQSVLNKVHTRTSVR